MELNASVVDYKSRSYELPKVEDHYSLLTTYHHLPIVLTVYLLGVKVLGPRWMQNRKPFVLKEVMMAYNLIQVFMNVYMAYIIIEYWGTGFLYAWNHPCNPIGETIGFNMANENKLMEVLYYTHVLKIIDLLDTVFFVLRKKQNQVTVLHVFHHTTMVVNSWLTLVPLREQIIALIGFLNIVVHVVMYSYYFLSAFGPGIQKYLWWKKHLTMMQLVQFTIMLYLLAKMKFSQCNCSPWFWGLWTINISAYFGLFLHFYIKSYKSNKQKVQ